MLVFFPNMTTRRGPKNEEIPNGLRPGARWACTMCKPSFNGATSSIDTCRWEISRSARNSQVVSDPIPNWVKYVFKSPTSTMVTMGSEGCLVSGEGIIVVNVGLLLANVDGWKFSCVCWMGDGHGLFGIWIFMGEPEIPSGKTVTNTYGKIHHFQWVNPL